MITKRGLLTFSFVLTSCPVSWDKTRVCSSSDASPATRCLARSDWTKPKVRAIRMMESGLRLKASGIASSTRQEEREEKEKEVG